MNAIKVVLIIFGLWLCNRVSAEPIHSTGNIRFHSEVLVGTKVITIADLSELNNIDKRLKRKLESHVVARLGKAKQINLSRSEIVQKISSAFGSHIKPKIVIPKSVRITLVDGRGVDFVEHQIKGQIQSLCKKCKIEVLDLKMPKVKMRVDESWAVHNIRSLPRGTKSFSMSIETKSTKPQKRKSMYWVRARIQIFKQVPVANRDLSRGETLGEKDLKSLYKDVTFHRDGLSTVKELIGRRLKNRVSGGGIITNSKIEKIRAVRRGEFVSASVIEGGWKVSRSLLVEKDASIGDQVSLRNPKTRKRFQGEVVGKGEVEIK